jgi:alpha-beta hydrolase superfamily lysophospholipase
MLPGFYNCVSDVVATALALRHLHPEQPIFFMGASLGAVLALEAALAIQAAGSARQGSSCASGDATPLNGTSFNADIRREACEIAHALRGTVAPRARSAHSIGPLDSVSGMHGGIAGVILHAPVGRIHLSAASNQLLCGVARAAAEVTPWLPVYKMQRGWSYHASVRQERLEEDLADPLYYRGVMYASTAASILVARDRMVSYCTNGLPLKVPLLIQHGSADELCNVETSQELHQAAGGGDGNATLHIVPGGHHDLLRERQEVVQAARDVSISWLQKELQENFKHVDKR